jgi:multimeric flavodoxin WrbA
MVIILSGLLHLKLRSIGMKVIAFNGSPRLRGNTHQALSTVLEEISAQGIETQIVNICENEIHGCKACGACFKNKDRQCIMKDDKINEYVDMIDKSQGLLIGSPVYFGSLSSQTKAFIDRVGYVNRANGDLFKHKVGAAVAINRRAGALETFNQINNFFLIGQMIVPGASYWNVGTALRQGEFASDVEGVNTMRSLGQNIAWLLQKLDPEGHEQED